MIVYAFTLDDGAHHEFEVDVDRPGRPSAPGAAPAPWTALTFHQCPNCPLAALEHPQCPAARDVEAIITRFRNLLSFQHATVQVHTPERTCLKRCDVQTGLRSLLGLVMATSGCPILSRLKGMAYYHLPFANVEETLFRTVSGYLLRQYFVHQAGGQADLELRGLAQLYDEVQTVSRALKERIDAASEKDANMNAIGGLIFLGMVVSSSLEEQLKELEGQFGTTGPTP